MKKKKEIILHQHKDQFGHIFGKLHPIDAIHENQVTMDAHVYTIENSK